MTIVHLQCAGINKNGIQCKRCIQGVLGGYGNRYFIHKTLGICDLRDKEWRCWQHGKTKENQ